MRARALAHGAPVAAALAGAIEPYVLVLQAGEVLPRHAAALLGEWMVRNGAPPALCADEDELAEDGARAAPLFKPQPNRALMLSGTLARGTWLFRRDWLAAHAPQAAGWAEALRLDLWLRLHEAGRAEETRRLPFVPDCRRALRPAGAAGAGLRGRVAAARAASPVRGSAALGRTGCAVGAPRRACAALPARGPGGNGP
jgi:hypothetical protein